MILNNLVQLCLPARFAKASRLEGRGSPEAAARRASSGHNKRYVSLIWFFMLVAKQCFLIINMGLGIVNYEI